MTYHNLLASKSILQKISSQVDSTPFRHPQGFPF
jgi:hypothetical protein